MASGSGEGSTIPEMDDYESLAALEIFQLESALIGRIKEQIQLMAGSSSEISVCFLGKSREETVEEFVEGDTDPLTVSLYQMDLDRTQFLLRSYLRISLQKIEKYMFHIFKRDELFNRLSKEEKLFAERERNSFINIVFNNKSTMFIMYFNGEFTAADVVMTQRCILKTVSSKDYRIIIIP